MFAEKYIVIGSISTPLSTAEATSGLGHFSRRLSPLVIAKKNGGIIFEEPKLSVKRLPEHMVGRCVFPLCSRCCLLSIFCFFHVPCRIRFGATLATRNCAVVLECVLCRVATPFVIS